MKIAIVGGIGSGKSIVLKKLADMGQNVCDCDEIYADICAKKEYIDLIDKEFGCAVDGKIDKSRLGNIVFSDKEKLKRLNAISHPLIFARLDGIYAESDGKLFVEVSAFDETMVDYFDEIVLVKSAADTRIKRVANRSGYSEEHIADIMSRQTSEEQLEKFSNFVIVNDGDEAELERQVEWILQWLG